MSQPNNNESVSPATWSIPASVSLYGKNFVVISGPELSKRLEELYKSGVREVEVVVDIPGHRLVATGRIYALHRRSTVYYYIYPHDATQRLLRELYYKHRGGAPAGVKKPVPVIVVAVIPKRGA